LPMLADRGVTGRLVLPVRFAALRRARSDLRNHRKLCLIDGMVAFVGSQNIVNRDFKPGIVNDELVARVEGPVVCALDAVFASDWFLETEQIIAVLPVPDVTGASELQAMPSGPDYRVPGYERLLVELVHEAQENITIVSPYLIPDEALLTALKNAVARGVAIDLVVSRVVDQRLVNLAQRSYYTELLEAGVRLHRYRDRLLHAKNVSIDGRIAVIGSSNADVRSFMLNAEISLILHDEANGVIARVFPASAKIWLASSVLCCDLTPAVPEVCGEADEEQHREYGQQNMAHIADAAKSGLDALTEKVTQGHEDRRPNHGRQSVDGHEAGGRKRSRADRDRADSAQAIQKAEPEHQQHRPPLEHIDGAAERGLLLDAPNIAMIAEPAAEGKEDLVCDKGPECCRRDGRRVRDQATVDHHAAQHDHRLALDEADIPQRALGNPAAGVGEQGVVESRQPRHAPRPQQAHRGD
ncbi:hypothetical protein LTR94_026441, partial [Friedmanniomyces endolithicus]